MDRRSGAEKLSESTLRAIEYSADLWTALRCIWRLRRSSVQRSKDRSLEKRPKSGLTFQPYQAESLSFAPSNLRFRPVTTRLEQRFAYCKVLNQLG